MTTEHALLSASGAQKWLNCPPSARLEETLPETESPYANEGRLAHEIAELKCRKAFVEPMGLRTFNSRLKKLQNKEWYQEEMLRHTDTYLDYLSQIVHGFDAPPYVAIEKRLDFSTYVPESFGTSDCIIIGGNILHVVDFKYGKSVPVSAEKNPQMMLYALGAFAEYAILYAINTVKMAIVQPRLDNVSEYEMSLLDLLAWAESIKPIAAQAFAGEGEFTPGEHCRFCRAKALCRARADFNTALEDFTDKKPPVLSNAEVGELLQRGQDLVKWLSDLQDYALRECLAGNEIPGWKAVEGRGSRQYKDVDAAFRLLIEKGIDEAMLYQRVPLTVANVEKLLGKTKYKQWLSDYVEMKPGKPTLVPSEDKREAITRPTAVDDFKEEFINE